MTSGTVDPTSPPGSVTSGPVDPTSPPGSVTTPSIPTTVTCHNGGTYNGKICICVLGFSGDNCQNAVPVKPGAFNQSVIINVVVMKVYIPEYDNPSTNEYNEFVENFLNMMKPRYKDVPFFKDVIVTKLSRTGPASTFDHTAEEIREVKAKAFNFKESTDNVNVAHDVILEVNNGNHEAQYNQSFEKVGEILTEVEGYDNISDTTFKKTSVDKKGKCLST
ncbi:mucin-17-like [Poecilia latipinna]|uniref:mucin-17-like n=1 Tax=Poecilia latipinna TaxID=48699 RepID=UPI00072E9847|nr:PREDICTED: mucin-17-like [Poecilia latipinna]